MHDLVHTCPSSVTAQHPNAGSSPFRLLEEARDGIGSLPLHEAAERYPLEAWMVWSSSHPVEYTQWSTPSGDSQVCTARPFWGQDVPSDAPACHLSSAELANTAFVLAVADQWQRVRTMLSSTQRSLEYTLMQEFQQRLKNFQRNAEIVRKHNAKHSKEPDKVCWLPLLNFQVVVHSSYEVSMSAPSGSHIMQLATGTSSPATAL